MLMVPNLAMLNMPNLAAMLTLQVFHCKVKIAAFLVIRPD
jgi:hypothetical protein